MFIQLKGRARRQAFTRRELIAVVFVIAILFVTAVGLLFAHRQRQQQLQCFQNLKQVALGFRMFPESSDVLPMGQSTNWGVGGTKELIGTGQVYRHFQSISNELASPRLLVCPLDGRKAASDFQWLQNSNISYFVGLDSDETKPQSFLAGDRHIRIDSPMVKGVVTVSTNTSIQWNENLHRPAASLREYLVDFRNLGAIAMADGTVHTMDDTALREKMAHAVRSYGDQRFEFPQFEWPPKR